MGFFNFLKLTPTKRPARPIRRLITLPLLPPDFDPNANRDAYCKAFEEIRRRASERAQKIVMEENEDKGSRSGDADNQVTSSDQEATSSPATTETGNKERQGKFQSNSVSKKRCSPPKQLSRSLYIGSSKKENTLNDMSENNNSILINEIPEESCGNVSPVSALDLSLPKQKIDIVRYEAAVRNATKLEDYRQKACINLGLDIRHNGQNANTEPCSSSSNTYRRYDSKNQIVNQKKSCGQDIPSEVYDEIVSAFGKTSQTNIGNHNVSLDQSRQSVNANTISQLHKESPFSRYNLEEQIVNENFAFLNDTQNRAYLSGSEANEEVEAGDEDESGPSRAMGSSTYKKCQLFMIECRSKDIEPVSSELINTSTTPFEFLTGSFRKTFVTIKRCRARCDAAARLVEEASERDLEILSRVKHPSIVILMAVSFQKNSINHMTPVLEPVDCTLNYYLHHKKKSFTNIESIMIVEQIGSAALYLHECGFVHSNICSHNILLRERPWLVKLSSFELATDIEFSAIKAQIEESSYPANLNINPKYFIYDKIHRSHFSMHNYQAPELLRADKRFVFPTPKADVYSLCLLLWELCNRTVPFDTHSKLDMELIITAGNLNIKFPERQRCHFFMDVFEAGLVVEPEDRSLDMPDLVDMLQNIELEIISIGENNTRTSTDRSSADRSSTDENFTYGSCTDSEVDSESLFLYPIHVDGVQFELDYRVLSPSLLTTEYEIDNFSEKQRTSTVKAKKNPQRPLINQCVGELLPAVKESSEGVNGTEKNDINAEGLRRNAWKYLDKNSHTSHQPENFLESAMDQNVTSNQQRPNLSVVDFSVNGNNSKSYGDILGSPETKAAKTLYNSEFESFIKNDVMSTTPIAQQNYMRRRNAWLNEQPYSSSHVYENGIRKEEMASEKDKNVNVSDDVVNPERLDEELPSISSRIQFFNSVIKLLKPAVSPAKVYKLQTNGWNRSTQTVTAHTKSKSGDINLGHKRESNMCNKSVNSNDDSNNSKVIPPKRFSVRENMCNKSVNSNDDSNNSKVIPPKRFSVRETIEKFEKRGPPSLSLMENTTKINVTIHQATASNNSGSKNSCHKLSSNVGASNKCQMSGETN